jgi:hypothetical protein
MHRATALQPLVFGGKFLIGLGLCGLVMHVLSLSSTEYILAFRVLLVTSSAFYLVTGTGLLLERRWGLLCLKGLLYFCCLGVPIGTYFALRGLRYMRRYNIEQFFI